MLLRVFNREVREGLRKERKVFSTILSFRPKGKSSRETPHSKLPIFVELLIEISPSSK